MASELRDIKVNEVRVPSAGESITEVDIAMWHVADGTRIEYGDKIATLETDKVSQDIMSEFTGKINHLVTSKQTVKVGDVIAEISSTESDMRAAETKRRELPTTKKISEKPSGSSAVMKLVILLVLGFAAVKYGVPLMDQISEKSVEVLDKDDIEKPKQAVEQAPLETTGAQPSIRITTGYETWEPAVREEVEYWLGKGVTYKLSSIDVNDTKDTMEVRYRTKKAEGDSFREKIVLKKDGFGERFIFIQGDKEFLVRPPQ